MSAQLELYGGGGTDIGVGLRSFIDRKHGPIDLLVIVTDCETPWPQGARDGPACDKRPACKEATAVTAAEGAFGQRILDMAAQLAEWSETADG